MQLPVQPRFYASHDCRRVRQLSAEEVDGGIGDCAAASEWRQDMQQEEAVPAINGAPATATQPRETNSLGQSLSQSISEPIVAAISSTVQHGALAAIVSYLPSAAAA